MKNILLLLFVFSIWGCIEDNGNYNYNPARDLIVEGVPHNITLTVGESVVMTPKAMVRYDKTKTEIEDAEYEWVIDGVVVSKESSYTYTAEEYGFFEGILRIKDPLTKSISYQDFGIRVETQYKTGFLILSEENGKGQLSMIRSKWSRSPSDTVIYEGEWKDVYKLGNDGEELLGNPVSITEHWAYDDNGVLLGEVTVLTEVNGRLKIQELNGFDFKRETYIEQEFKDEKLPINFNPQAIMHTCFDSFILDKSGDVYIRRSVNKGYHTGYFADNIRLWDGQKFTDLIFTQYKEISGLLAIEKDATGKRNYVGIYSDYWRDDANLKRLQLVGDDYIDDFKNIDGEVMWSDWRDIDEWYESGMSVIYKTQAGDYILHCFDMDEASRTTFEILASTKINLTAQRGLTNLRGMCTNKRQNYTYFWDDHTIYALENWYNEDFFEMKKFDKKIMAVATQSIFSTYAKYPTALAIAFEDGSVEIWEIDKSNPAQLSKKVYTSINKFGNIKNIIFKVGSCVDFFEC